MCCLATTKFTVAVGRSRARSSLIRVREATSLEMKEIIKADQQKRMGGTNETMAVFSMAVTSNSERGGRGRKASEFTISDVREWPTDNYGQRPDTRVGRRVDRLRRAALPVDTVELARYLIGKTLVHDLPGGRVSGRIVETEAYVVGDKAGHAFPGRTPHNQTLYLGRGRAYVYLIYGLHYLLNVTSERVGRHWSGSFVARTGASGRRRSDEAQLWPHEARRPHPCAASNYLRRFLPCVFRAM